MLKRLSLFILLFLMSIVLLCSCKKKTDYSKITAEKPDMSLKTGDYNLDFIAMHNSVIDYLTSEATPFFFVKDNSFDISGSNEEKLITVKCTCMTNTTVQDLDLFLSMVLNGIGINASEQDYRFKKPSTDSEGTYIDFGTVFDTYSLKIYSDLEDKSVLRDVTIKHGQRIPIDPKYIKE